MKSVQRRQRYIIALVLEEENIRAITKLMESLRLRDEVCFVVNEKDKIPHVSLMHFYSDKPELVFSSLADLSMNISCLTVRKSAILYEEGGWYFLVPNERAELNALHCLILKKLKQYFIRPSHIKEEKLNNLNRQQRENYLLYGYPYIGRSFTPHITLTRTLKKDKSLCQDKLKTLENALIKLPLNFTKLVMAEAGSNGTISFSTARVFSLTD